MAAFADEINNCPMVLALLQMRELKISQFTAPQSAAKQYGKNGAITLPFESVCRAGKTWGDMVSERVVWHVVKQYAQAVGLAQVAPHDLRRSCAKLCHACGGELEQIQFLLGHVSVQTTERYLGCKQRIRGAVNDNIGIEPQLGSAG